MSEPNRVPLTWLRVAPYVLIAAGFFALAAAGKLRGFPLLPWVAGPIWAFSGWTKLRGWRRSDGLLPATLAVAGSLLALASPFVHTSAVQRHERAVEAQLIERVASQGLPPLVYDAQVNLVAEGESWDRASFDGRLTILNFWATWCPPCREELPMLGEFAREHGGDDLRLVGFTQFYDSSGEPGEAATRAELAKVEATLREREAGYPSLVARGGQTHAGFAVEVLPTTVLVGPDGQVVAHGTGIAGTKRVLARALELQGAVGR